MGGWSTGQVCLKESDGAYATVGGMLTGARDAGGACLRCVASRDRAIHPAPCRRHASARSCRRRRVHQLTLALGGMVRCQHTRTESLRISRRLESSQDGSMARRGKYLKKVRERAVQLVFEQQHAHRSEWAASNSIAEKMGCTAETLRKWVRQSECDGGKRPVESMLPMAPATYYEHRRGREGLSDVRLGPRATRRSAPRSVGSGRRASTACTGRTRSGGSFCAKASRFLAVPWSV